MLRSIRKNGIPLLLVLGAIFAIWTITIKQNAADQMAQDLHAGDIARFRAAVTAQHWQPTDVRYETGFGQPDQVTGRLLVGRCEVYIAASPQHPGDITVTINQPHDNAQGYVTSSFPLNGDFTPDNAVMTLRVSYNMQNC